LILPGAAEVLRAADWDEVALEAELTGLAEASGLAGLASLLQAEAQSAKPARRQTKFFLGTAWVAVVTGAPRFLWRG
jgi:hypothetical protein